MFSNHEHTTLGYKEKERAHELFLKPRKTTPERSPNFNVVISREFEIEKDCP